MDTIGKVWKGKASQQTQYSQRKKEHRMGTEEIIPRDGRR